MAQQFNPTPTRQKDLTVTAFCTAVSILLFIFAEIVAWRMLARARGDVRRARLAAFVGLLGASQTVAWLQSLLRELEIS